MSPAPVQVNSSSKLPSPGFNAGARPYRSHKVRACDLCRKRKSRCTVDIPGQSCLLCRVQGADCHYQEEANADASVLSGADRKSWPGPPSLEAMPGHKRKRSSDELTHMGQNNPPRQPINGPSPHGTTSSGGRRESDLRRKDMDDPQNESVLIVGPMVAEDAQVIEKHMPPERSSQSEEPNSHPYNIYSSDPRKPVLYTTISRRRKGMRKGTPPGENQKEVLEQILGPFKHDLVRLFIDRFNVSFPIFDGESFWESFIADDLHDPPAALVCQVYSMSLVYWKHTQKLACHPKPDVRYAINMTVAALHEEFSAPGLDTISAALIDLTGRPIFSMTGNAVSCGRMLSLANCLGLNRDPSNWKLSQAEKNQRIRLWWGVVIHDRWGSFGHGVPPQISKNQYDVPLPTVEVLVPSNLRTTERVRAAHCHIYLCRLTETLGELLPLVYGLQHKPARETSKKLRQIRTDLDIWEDSLPDWLRGPTIHTGERIYGASSLQLAFLAVKMLVSRVELNEVNNSETENTEARRYFQTECRRSAEEIVGFITSLRKDNFTEFWLPYSAFHLTSTATLLVRCAFETTDSDVARSCLSNVETLRSVLRRVREEEDWDVADMCLDHCERIMHRLPGTGATMDQAFTTAMADSGLVNPAAISLPETQTNNDIVDDMMSISNTFGTMDGFPFDMTGIWDVSVFQDVNLT
ncbi:transcriptional regulator family: Fungal Specific TF [Penicillium roqueforti]|uniref:Zn(2)-C6 fungal-type DNA-binding domain n=1 Tax=Penicillium roqueforti (strain FM164) TaxID=1365484 RepID=W6QHG0_PENRF|nr:transcriptional regulator family: Fungal Specific TF [Penicillium roqueforti]CDM33634.1 Zn(2)-C6 fungal-type DNA-binding domain [Penicillium roqueforti FM164]KAF9248790.1 transcriptional regulator family: Fungal Specific TF [Penicillium roqueforti]KAI1831666.1 transcriptional regulator family: Fungal Specific TF [Penicillium roqueforti]KAI2681655.1 transcriptional regulator family: Fungal Specific TF [Penicillium roqueforti]KAI2689044.1 transcriptional regulator family: Fungal Specific TF [